MSFPQQSEDLRKKLMGCVAKYKDGASVRCLIHPEYTVEYATSVLLSILTGIHLTSIVLKQLNNEEKTLIETKYKEFRDFGKNNKITFEIGVAT